MANQRQRKSVITAEERAILEHAQAVDEARELLLSVDGEAPPGDEFESELFELTAGSKIRVSQKSSKRGSPGGYMFTVSADDTTLDDLFDRIQSEYGGGEYRLRVQGEGGKFKFNRDITIADPIKKIEPEKAAVAPVQGEDRLATVLLAMQQNTQTMIESLRDQQVRSSENLQNVLLEIIKSGNAREVAPPQSPQDMLGLLAMAKEFFGKPANPLDQFLEGVKFRRELDEDSGGSGDNPLSKMVEILAPSLVALSKQATAPGVPAPVRPAAPGIPAPVVNLEQAPAVPVAIAEGEKPVEKTELHAILQPCLVILLNAARADGDPDLYAEMALDHVSDEDVIRLLGDPDRYAEVFATMPPEVIEQKAWFDRLRESLLRFVSEPEEGGDDSTGGESDVPGITGQAHLPDSAGNTDQS